MTRFGMGYRPDLPEQVGEAPRAWLRRQLSSDMQPRPPVTLIPDLKARWAIRFPTPEEKRMAPERDSYQTFVQYSDRIRDARIMTALQTETPLRERLVHFFFEHFTVSQTQPSLLGLTDLYENEAIRPHVTGPFRTLLGAVMHHPLMHIYLNNNSSIGPNSQMGQKNGLGINENLGRELLELHTLGVSGGYKQSDVAAAAQMLTGWYIKYYDRNRPLDMMFLDSRHEPGTKIILAREFQENGQKEMDDLLDFLAGHPSTARFISRKLAKYFISDQPPDDVVQEMTAVYLARDGRIDAMMDVLLDHPSSWQPQGQKVLLPEDWGIAFLNLFGLSTREAAVEVRSASQALGHGVHAARSPKGWPDDRDVWFSPGNMVLRAGLAARMYEALNCRDDLDTALSIYFRNASIDVLATIRGAPTLKDAYGLIAASPHFCLR
ncbi:DUF1800 domain-containing protein [Tistrella mobilis]